MNIFAAAASLPSPQPTHPPGFDINLSTLRSSYAAAITKAIHEGQLDAFILNGQYWVSRAELQDLLPPGHDSHDPADACCFIPS